MPKEYACNYCGWRDTNKSFFYEKEGEQYCSLHINEEDEANDQATTR